MAEKTENGPRARRIQDPEDKSRPKISKKETFSIMVHKKEDIDIASRGRNLERKHKMPQRTKMNGNQKLVLMTWIEHREDKKDAKAHIQQLVSRSEKILDKGTFYSCCELFDLYFKGGLFPLFHQTTDQNVISKLMEQKNFLEASVLGPEYIVEQGIYEEVASIRPPCEKKGSQTVIAASGFKTIEGGLSNDLIKEWKGWTGARGFMIDILQTGLSCHQVKFYVRTLPEESTEGFSYIVTTEVGICQPSDEGLLADLLQRFRVERWLGYRSLYQDYHRANNSADVTITEETDN